jgi:hypothetical protein
MNWKQILWPNSKHHSSSCLQEFQTMKSLRTVGLWAESYPDTSTTLNSAATYRTAITNIYLRNIQKPTENRGTEPLMSVVKHRRIFFVVYLTTLLI